MKRVMITGPCVYSCPMRIAAFAMIIVAVIGSIEAQAKVKGQADSNRTLTPSEANKDNANVKELGHANDFDLARSVEPAAIIDETITEEFLPTIPTIKPLEWNLNFDFLPNWFASKQANLSKIVNEENWQNSTNSPPELEQQLNASINILSDQNVTDMELNVERNVTEIIVLFDEIINVAETELSLPTSVYHYEDGDYDDLLLGDEQLEDDDEYMDVDYSNFNRTLGVTGGKLTWIHKSIIKWSLICVIIVIPLIMIPIIFLFMRTQNTNPRQDDNDDDTESRMKPRLHPDAANLTQPIALIPASFTQRDPYLYAVEQSRLNANNNDKTIIGNGIDCFDLVIRSRDRADSKPFYCLSPNDSLLVRQTGDLYHAPSGLLFVAMPEWSYNSVSRLAIRSKAGSNNGKKNATEKSECEKDVQFREPTGDEVYCADTKQMYERCLSIGFDAKRRQWFLPRKPPGCESIRRVSPDRLPSPLDREQYRELLSSCSSNSDKNNHAQPKFEAKKSDPKPPPLQPPQSNDNMDNNRVIAPPPQSMFQFKAPQEKKKEIKQKFEKRNKKIVVKEIKEKGVEGGCGGGGGGGTKK